MTRFLIAFSLSVALFAACRKDYDTTIDKVLGPIPTVNVQSTLTGRIFDQEGHPLSGATVEVAGQVLTTDDRGLFTVYNKRMNKNGTYIRVSQPGFFDARKFAFPSLNAVSYIEIKMTPKSLTTTFHGSDAVDFSVQNGGTNVHIPANAIRDANGQPYTGQVEVYSIWLNPADAHTYEIMPGDLRAQDAEGYAKVLTSFGMMGVELESPGGEKLNLLPGVKASVTMSIPFSMASFAPDSIPTWHFDENNGYWKEEGHALRAGNAYKFEVSHFSYWNCDIPGETILLNGKLTNSTGDPLVNVRVQFAKEVGAYIYFVNGTTNSDGTFSGPVPANTPLIMNVLTGCSTTNNLQVVGPFEANTDLGTIQLDLLSYTLTGNLLDCNANPVTEGLIAIEQHDTIISVVPVDALGHFSVIIPNCGGDPGISVRGYDLVNFYQSPLITVTSNGNILDAGDIPVCTNLDEYVHLIIGNNSKTFIDPTIHLETGSGAMNYLNAYGVDTSSINIDLGNSTHSIASMYSYILEGSTYKYYGCSYCSGCDCSDLLPGYLIYTQYPINIGDYAVGYCTGNIRSAAGVPTPYSISFRIKRE